MKILKRFLREDSEVIFDSEKDNGIISIELENDFTLLLSTTIVNGEELLEVMLQPRVMVARLVVYPQITNVIRLGKGKL